MSTTPHANVSWPLDRQLGTASPAKLGMWIFLLSDWLTFAGLLIAYGILRGGSEVWRHPGEPALNVRFTAGLTAILLASSVTMLLAQDAARAEDRRRTSLWLALTALGGVLFLTGQYAEWFGLGSPGLMREGLVFGQSAYASTFYVVTGFHGLHVTVGVIYLAATLGRNWKQPVGAGPVEQVGLFWHFVDLVWNLVFVVLYLVPGVVSG